MFCRIYMYTDDVRLYYTLHAVICKFVSTQILFPYLCKTDAFQFASAVYFYVLVAAYKACLDPSDNKRWKVLNPDSCTI